jgi:ATP-binding cassette subfamily B protein/subfamily B ATP-binding cassette protein MsbA
VTRTLIIPKIKDEFFMQFGIYFIGGLFIMNGDLRIGDLFAFLMYYGMFSAAVKNVSGADAELQSAMPYTDRWLAEIDKSVSAERKEKVMPDDSNTILFENISFNYPESEREIFKNFTLQINKGERIAVTGKSGCGKTTLLKLLTGMITPTAGSIFFSNVSLADINIAEMHRRIGFVMQENMLFNTTVRDNLLYGRRNANDDELREACEKAYILDFIESLPDKFGTVIGERGIKLSGGQKQRLVLARLFLRDADIFIFGEATNALDPHSEDIVHDAVRNIGKDKTVIIVAHRESSVNLCSRKIVLEMSE